MRTPKIDFATTEKAIRAQIIRHYMQRNNISHAVCFSCGNASAALKQAGVKLLDCSPSGDLYPRRWFTMEEIRTLFAGAFDATSGHLPIDIMLQISAELREAVKLENDTTYIVPTGSGETIVCLKMAFPAAEFVAEYNDAHAATEYNEHAPLNPLVAALFKVKKQ